VIRTPCQTVAARVQAGALNTTGIDGWNGRAHPWFLPSTSHELQPSAPVRLYLGSPDNRQPTRASRRQIGPQRIAFLV